MDFGCVNAQQGGDARDVCTEKYQINTSVLMQPRDVKLCASS